MATERFYRNDGRVVAHVTTLGDGSDFDFSASDWVTPFGVDMHTYIVGAACDVKMLVDSGGDFTSPETTITLDSFGSNGISEGNSTPLIDGHTAGRITNTSGGPADYAAIGDIVRGN